MTARSSLPSVKPAYTGLLRLAFGLLAFTVTLGLTYRPPVIFASVDELVRDHFVRFAASGEAEERIAVVDIDEASLAEAGAWPWPRARLADLAEILMARHGAQALALDMVLPEPADPEGDRRLAALAEHGVLVTAIAFDFVSREQPILTGRPAAGSAADAVLPALEATGHVANHSMLANARCAGNIGFVPDADGVLRRLPARVRFGSRDYPMLAQAMLACTPAQADPGVMWRIPFRRDLTAFAVIPAAAVLAGRAPDALLRGRKVIIGSSALGLVDRVATPLSASTAGVMVHASALSALLDEAGGARPTPWPGTPLALAWAFAASLAAILLLPRLAAWQGACLLGGWALLWLPLAFAAAGSGAEFSLLAPVVSSLVLMIVTVPLEWWQSQMISRRILEVFEHYVARPVIDELLDRKMLNILEPTQKGVTVLIADMESYTRHTTSLPLAEAARLTRDFLDALTRPILETGGTLDKYTGDGLVAFWGAPLPCPDQAERAVHAGERILAEVAALNARRAPEGLAPVRARIGIESGLALVGDLGTPFRSTYTAVGDCINFASKLQESARGLEYALVIGPGTQKLLPEGRLVALGEILLRGYDQPVSIYSIAS